MIRLNRHVCVRIGNQNTASLGPTGTDTRLGRQKPWSWGGQKVQVLEGHTESEAWTVRLVDTSTGEEITSKLGTSGGRPDLLRRLIDASVRSTPPGSWSSTHLHRRPAA